MFKKLLKAKLDAQQALINTALAENRAMNPEEQAQFNTLQEEIKNLEASIAAEEVLNAAEKARNTPVNTPIFATPNTQEPLKLFKNFGEQLKAIRDHSKFGKIDARLERINNAASGMSEGNGADGGFAVQEDFAGMMMETAATSGNILPLLDTYDISAPSNKVEWVEIDETSVSTTVYGGVQVYWAAEAAAVAASKPKLIEKEMKLEKLMGVAYATYEMEADSSFTSELFTRSFTLAIQRELENTVINGIGAGKPLGFLKSPSLVSVSKESGQAAATVVWENIAKMYNRALDKNKSVWLMHPDVQQELDFMAFPIGVGGVPVYLQASSVGSLASLKGRPIVESDLCAALGTVGDINFADLSQYMLIKKGGVLADTSIHVQFLAAENCFRFIFRANGMPKKNSALTIKNSSNTRSSFVSLATRA